ncbi:SH3 domain-containing protein [Azospirillum sp. sgz302134]
MLGKLLGWCRKTTTRVAVGVALILVAGAVTAEAADASADGPEKRVALVVGNAQYHSGGAAPGVAANAGTIADALRRAGFAVTMADNLDHRGMVAALTRFGEALGEADLGFFYYSGVALSLSAKGFLVPVDARLASEYDVIFDTIELDYALKEIQRAGRKAVAVFDPVPAHPLADTLAASMGEAGKSVKPVLAAPSALDNLFVVYAHRPGTAPAPFPSAGPSAFTLALAQEMIKPGVPLRDALAEVARTVVGRTRGAQHPWLQDRLGGDLVLVPGGSAKVAALPPANAPPNAPAKPEPPHEAKPAAVAEVEVDPLDEKRVVTRDTKLRAGPDNRSAVIGGLRHDSEVKVTGRPKRNAGWLRIEHEGKSGYAYAANLTKPDEAAPQAPVVAEAPSGPATASGATALAPGVYTVLRATNLFTRPTLGARSLSELEPGQPVTLVESVPDSNWVRVRDREGQEGYVSVAALSGRGGETAAAPPPSASRPATVTRGDVDPLAGTLSGNSGSAEIAALPAGEPTGRSLSVREPAALGLAAPYRDSFEAGRNAASRAASAAGAARAAEGRALQAQAGARQAAEKARAGSTTYRFPNGDLYEGSWARGAGILPIQGQANKEGVGVYHFANGQLYEGEWKGDAMSGVGVLTFPSGDRYVGSFFNNMPNGPGVYRFANGDVYTGEVRQGRVEGHGELAFTNGDRYVGMVVDRQPSGHGELIMRGGGRHVGLFRDGIQDGPGTAVTEGGALRPGVWRGATLLRE